MFNAIRVPDGSATFIIPTRTPTPPSSARAAPRFPKKVVGHIGDGKIEVFGSVPGNINGLWAPSTVHAHGNVDGEVGEGLDGAGVFVDGTIGTVGGRTPAESSNVEET